MKKLFILLLSAFVMLPLAAQTTEPLEDSWETDYELMKSDGWKACNKGMTLKDECILMHKYSMGSLGDDRKYCYGGARTKNKSRKEGLHITAYQAQKDLAEFLIFAYATGREDLHASKQVHKNTVDGRTTFKTVDQEHGIEINFRDGNHQEGYKAVYTFSIQGKPMPKDIPSIAFQDAMEQLIEHLSSDIVVLSFYRKKDGVPQVQSLAYSEISKALDDIRNLIMTQWASNGAVEIILQDENKR